MEQNTIIIATRNKGKIREISQLCSGLPITLYSLFDLWEQPPDIQETGTTFEENARIKAQWVFVQKKTWVLADDSGLEVDILNGEPGVYSARYAKEGATDSENIEKLLGKLSAVPEQKRTARFRCVMVLHGPEGIWVTQGTCEGVIASARRGTEGFGYDPIFIPDTFTKTFAELTSEEKNRISHRAKALTQMREVLYGLFA